MDGAIHRAAGPQLLAECRTLGGCPTGEAKITAGYNLPAKFVIHTVGPVWHGGGYNEDTLLAMCYRNSMALAKKHEVRSIAFPAVSTGIYDFPLDRATEIAVTTVREMMAEDRHIERVIFACFSERALTEYQAHLGVP